MKVKPVIIGIAQVGKLKNYKPVLMRVTEGKNIF
jgi:hypothetical protein